MLRLTITPTPDNGPRTASQVQVNRILTLPVTKLGPVTCRILDGADIAAADA